ncbi:MAG: ROK family transcriptional regulator [Ahrensia sp.]|nr:ROK family transcriptional regulator [Ahrensia sp.]
MGEKSARQSRSLEQVRDLNRHKVLAELRRRAPVSRAAIAKSTGLSAATISAIVTDLIEEGYVASDSTRSKGRGRPKIALSLNPQAALVCAVYFELRNVSATLIDNAGGIVAHSTMSLHGKKLDRQTIKSALLGSVRSVQDKLGSGRQLAQIAVGFQGVTSVCGTRLLWSPVTQERDLPIAQWLEDAFAAPARIANDCDMIVRALNWREPDLYSENFAAVLLSHGVGMGLFLRGEVVNGTRSSGIEFGHMNHIPGGALCRCGQYGCIEAYAGDYAIARVAAGQSETQKPADHVDVGDLHEIRDAAMAQEPLAMKAIAQAGDAIGAGIANLFALVDEFPVALVGRGMIFLDLMKPSIRKAISSATGSQHYGPLELSSYEDTSALVLEGCAIAALMENDAAQSIRGQEKDVAA